MECTKEEEDRLPKLVKIVLRVSRKIAAIIDKKPTQCVAHYTNLKDAICAVAVRSSLANPWGSLCMRHWEWVVHFLSKL